MSTTNLLDKKNMINAILRVGGKKMNFVSLELIQEYGQHHQFKIQVDYEVLSKTFMSDPTQQIELIGQMVVVDIQHGSNNGAAYVFNGVITKIKMTGKDGKKGYVVLEGFSPTIMLERGRRMDIYSDMTLRNIFKKLIDGVYSDYMKFLNEPTYETKIDFLMQYNETDWEFLQRIAYIYGENLFFSGSEILFGQYEEWEPVKLTYDHEISDIEFCTRMLANRSVAYQYVAEQDSILEKESPDKIENSNAYLDAAEEVNLALTKGKPAKNIIGANITTLTELDELVKRDKTRTAAQTVYITGKSKTYESTIGRLIKVYMPENFSSKKELGTYRVVKSIHRIDERLIYSNEFEAVPASLKTMPVTEPKMPVAESILGKVSSNEDPKNQGRVQVDFSFANQYSKIWMRVMTPHAGSSDVVSKNRGMVFIPEKGDQVMVGFEYGDPNRPYVMGSMFHGGNAEGGGENNFKKSIITRSGSKLEFTDSEDESKYTVILQHNDHNTISISVEKNKGTILVESTQDIFIKAPELIQMEARQIVMKAETIKAEASDTINMVAQSLFHIESADKMEMLAAQIAEESSGEFTQKAESIAMKASSKMDIDGGGKLNVKAGSIKMNQ